jgi:virulence factor
VEAAGEIEDGPAPVLVRGRGKSAMGKVKVALVGAGGIANGAHCPALAELPDVEMSAICDVDQDRARETAGKFGIPQIHPDYRDMIDEVNPDAVYVLVRPHQIYDVAEFALKRGKHVFLEKPPGVTSEQTRQLRNVAAANNCLTAVGFQRRFTPITVECLRRVRERGPVRQVLVTFLKWMEEDAYYGGSDILYGDVIHIVDTMRWMAGAEAEDVYSDVKAHGTSIATAHNALVRFSNGAIGLLQSNHRVGGRQLRMEIHGDGISCVIAPEESAVVYEAGRDPEQLSAPELAGGPEMFRMGFLQESRHFVDCMKSGRQPDTSLRESLQTMKLCDAIMRNSPPWTSD